MQPFSESKVTTLSQSPKPASPENRTTSSAFSIESGRVLVTLDADFANILRFPPAGTPGVMRLRINPPTEDAIRDLIHRTLHALKDTPLAGRLVVSHGDVIRIRN